MNQSYRLICSIQSGQYLGVNEHNNNSHQQVKTYDDCGDNCIWKQDNKAMKFVSVANINVTFHMKHPNEWNIISASPKLPSQYVKELQTIGYAIIENILDENSRKNLCRKQPRCVATCFDKPRNMLFVLQDSRL